MRIGMLIDLLPVGNISRRGDYYHISPNRRKIYEKSDCFIVHVVAKARLIRRRKDSDMVHKPVYICMVYNRMTTGHILASVMPKKNQKYVQSVENVV